MLKICFFPMIAHLMINRSAPISNDDIFRCHQTSTPNTKNSVDSSTKGNPPIEQSFNENMEHFWYVGDTNYGSYTSEQPPNDTNCRIECEIDDDTECEVKRR